jgi:hypothetical protein
MTNKICTGRKVFLFGPNPNPEDCDRLLELISATDPFVPKQSLLATEIEQMLLTASTHPAPTEASQQLLFVNQGGDPGERILLPETLIGLLEKTIAFNRICLDDLFDYLAVGDPQDRLVIVTNIEANSPPWSMHTPLQIAMRLADINRLFRFDVFSLDLDVEPTFVPDVLFRATKDELPAIVLERKVFFPELRPSLEELAVAAFELDRPFVFRALTTCPGCDDYNVPLIYVRNDSDLPGHSIACSLLELEENPAFSRLDLTAFHDCWEQDVLKSRLVRAIRFTLDDKMSKHLTTFLGEHLIPYLWAIELLTVAYPDFAPDGEVKANIPPLLDPNPATIKTKVDKVMTQTIASLQTAYPGCAIDPNPGPYADWWASWGDASVASPDRIESMIVKFFDEFMICNESALTGLEVSLVRCVPVDTEHAYGILQIYKNGRFSIYIHTPANDSIGLVELAVPDRYFCGEILDFFVPKPILARYFRPLED